MNIKKTRVNLKNKNFKGVEELKGGNSGKGKLILCNPVSCSSLIFNVEGYIYGKYCLINTLCDFWNHKLKPL